MARSSAGLVSIPPSLLESSPSQVPRRRRSKSMYTALIILHILVAFIMVGVILLQSGKGAEIVAAFGGSSQTIFGSLGAGTFLSMMSAVGAIIYMITSLWAIFLCKKQNYFFTV